MSCFFLKLNAAKSQIIAFSTDNLKKNIFLNGTFVNSFCVKFCNTVKNLDYFLTKSLRLNLKLINVYHLFIGPDGRCFHAAWAVSKSAH